MIAHQHPGVNPPPRALARFAESRQKAFPVRIVQENRLPPVTPIEDMVNGSFKFDACFASHACYL